MAHEITNAHGRYEFAYTGTAPWHGLGNVLPAAATKADMIRAAGLDWVVLPQPLYLEGGKLIPGYIANVRSDTQDVLGVVSEGYKVFQNGAAFEFLDNVVNSAGAHYHTAGSIRRGRKVFACAKLPNVINVTPQDVVEQYILLVNNHDGDGGLHVRFTPVRVVCANTLRAALGGFGKYQYSVWHLGDLNAQVKAAQTALGIGVRYFDVAGNVYRSLAAKQITAGLLDTFLSGFVPVPVVDAASSEDAKAARDQALEIHERVRCLFETGLGTDLPGVAGTAWGAVNAAIEWAERVRPAKKDGAARKGSDEAYLFGPVGQDLRDRAFKSGLALLSN